MDKLHEEYRRQFYEEVRDILARVCEDILRAEADPGNEELLNAVFRGIHTVKGSAGAFDLDALSRFTHHLETVLTLLRQGDLALNAEMVDLVLQAADALNAMIDAYEAGNEPGFDHELAERFRRLVETAGTAGGVADASAVPPPAAAGSGGLARAGLSPELAALVDGWLQEGLNVFEARIAYTSELLANGYDPLVLLGNLKGAARRYLCLADPRSVPPLDRFSPLELYLRPVVYLATELDEDEVRDLAFDPELMELRDLSGTDGEVDASGEPVDEESLREFLTGAVEMSAQLERLVIEYEKSESRPALDEIFRVVHTIKGDADYIGLATLAAFAHALESVLERLRSGTLRRTPEVADALLRAVDFVRDAVRRLAAGERRGGLPAVYGLLENMAATNASASAPPVSSFSEELGEAFLSQAAQYREVLAGTLREFPRDPSRGGAVRRALSGLGRAAGYLGARGLADLSKQGLAALDSGDEPGLRLSVGEIVTVIEGIEGEPRRLGQILVDDGLLTGDDLDDALSRQKKIGELLVETGKVSEEDVRRALRTQELNALGRQIRQSAAVPSEPENRTMRVDEGKIDQFSTTIGELVVARNTLEYLIGGLSSLAAVPGSTLKAFKDNLYLLSRVTNDMQTGVMSLRMIPIRGTFQKFTRVVRDISRRQGKLIEYVTVGEETEIDKKVADMLSDPLIHIVRNSCDHGLESPAERAAAGKGEKGTLLLKASQEGSNLTIRIRDDGRGIDRNRLYEKALQMGIPSPSPEDDSLLDLIFLPGLSTKGDVTDLSGRGVGMDVVNTAVKNLGGTIRVTSEPGNGTEITLTLPMTMGISEALIVLSGGRKYALPLDCVVEAVKLDRGDLRRIHDRLGFHYRGEVIPADGLDRLLHGRGGFSRQFCGDSGSGGDELEIVILRCGSERLGVIVECLERNMEIAIKPPPDALANIDVISGVSILGDGSVVLVLNPDRLA